jgi:hypothetical protein
MEGELKPLPGTFKKSSIGQGLFPEGGRKTVITSV